MPSIQPEKVDLYKLHKDDYVAPKKPKLIDVAAATYLSVDGSGKPGGEVFQVRIGALYGMAYTAKFISKFAGRDYVVCKLEGLWGIGAPDGADPAGFCAESMTWKLLMRVPDFVTDELLDKARTTLKDKGKEGPFHLAHLESIEEGRCVQMLHVGPYEDEQRTIEAMRAFAGEQGLRPHRWHHEIYLSDPRRVPAERLKTILRQPVTLA